jgi:hypothetical protein
MKAITIQTAIRVLIILITEEGVTKYIWLISYKYSAWFQY